MTGGGSEVAETQQSKILSNGWQCSFFLANEKEEQRLNSWARAIFFNVSHIASLRQIGERTDCEEYRSHDKSLCTLIRLSISVPFYLFSPFSMDTSVSYHATADTAAGTVMYIFTISRLSSSSLPPPLSHPSFRFLRPSKSLYGCNAFFSAFDSRIARLRRGGINNLHNRLPGDPVNRDRRPSRDGVIGKQYRISRVVCSVHASSCLKWPEWARL